MGPKRMKKVQRKWHFFHLSAFLTHWFALKNYSKSLYTPAISPYILNTSVSHVLMISLNLTDWLWSQTKYEFLDFFQQRKGFCNAIEWYYIFLYFLKEWKVYFCCQAQSRLVRSRSKKRFQVNSKFPKRFSLKVFETMSS